MSRVKSIEEQLLESMGHTNVGEAHVKHEAVALPSKLEAKRITEAYSMEFDGSEKSIEALKDLFRREKHELSVDRNNRVTTKDVKGKELTIFKGDEVGVKNGRITVKSLSAGLIKITEEEGKILRVSGAKGSPEAEEFMAKIEDMYKKNFPKGMFMSGVRSILGGPFVSIVTGIQPKGKQSGGIIENDPAFQSFSIDLADDGSMPEKLSIDSRNGGSLATNPEKGSYMAMGRVKFGWKKKTGNLAQILKHMDLYFKKMRSVVDANKDNIFGGSDLIETFIVNEADLPTDVIAKIKANNDKMTDLKKNGGSQEEIDALEKENDELNGGNKTSEKKVREKYIKTIPDLVRDTENSIKQLANGMKFYAKRSPNAKTIMATDYLESFKKLKEAIAKDNVTDNLLNDVEQTIKELVEGNNSFKPKGVRLDDFMENFNALKTALKNKTSESKVKKNFKVEAYGSTGSVTLLGDYDGVITKEDGDFIYIRHESKIDKNVVVGSEVKFDIALIIKGEKSLTYADNIKLIK
jgi:hypothetical protein